MLHVVLPPLQALAVSLAVARSSARTVTGVAKAGDARPRGVCGGVVQVRRPELVAIHLPVLNNWRGTTGTGTANGNPRQHGWQRVRAAVSMASYQTLPHDPKNK